MRLPSDQVRVLGMLIERADADDPPRAGTVEMSRDLGIDEVGLIPWMHRSYDGQPSRPDLAANCYYGNFVSYGLVEVRDGFVHPTPAGRAEFAKYDENHRPLATT